MLLELWTMYKSIFNVFKEGYIKNQMHPNARYHMTSDPMRRNEVYKRIACKHVGITNLITEKEIFDFEKNIKNKELRKLTDKELEYLEFIYYHTLLPESTYEADISRFNGCIGYSLIGAILFIRSQLAKKYKPTHYVQVEMTKINMKKVYQRIPELFVSNHTKNHLPGIFWECYKRFGLKSNLVNMVIGRYLDGFEVHIEQHSKLQNKKISYIRYNQTVLILLPRKSAIETVEDICKKFFTRRGIEINIRGRKITDRSLVYFEKAEFVYSKNKKVYFQPKEIYVSDFFKKLNEVEKKYKKNEYKKEEFVNEMLRVLEKWLSLYRVYCTRVTLEK